MYTKKKKVMEGIVKQCGGLPLAIVLVSGVLAEDSSLKGCEKVRQDLSKSLNKGNNRCKGISDVLALSYRDLPYHLKACFLYLSLFPEDLMINAKRLVQMWIAEGFVSAAATGEGTTTTMLDVGLSYLNELVNRCIVQADITKFSKRVRSCRLHDLMREFCRSKALEENFFEEFGLQQSICSAASLNRIRRLAVHSKPVTTTNTVPRGKQYQHVRSCVVYWDPRYDEVMDPWDMTNSLLKSFKFIKVFNVAEFPNYRQDGVLSGALGKLIHLRYLRVPQVCQVLPPCLGNLIQLQILDLLRVSDKTHIPDVLWMLKELTHLYLPIYEEGSTYKLRLDGLSKLETLVGFDTDRSEVGDLATLPNLRRVRITCKVTELTKILASPVFINLNSLLRRSHFIIRGGAESQEEHTLISLVSASPHIRKLGLFGCVYEETFLQNLNANITSLWLTGCGLKEDPMPALQKMPTLRKLGLFDGSYIGEKMVCLAPKKTTGTTEETISTSTEVSFPQLTFLVLYQLEISEWKVEQGALPCLSKLVIDSCKKLNEIPDGLRFIDTLERVTITAPNELLKRSLEEVGENFNIQHVPSVEALDFDSEPPNSNSSYIDREATIAHSWKLK